MLCLIGNGPKEVARLGESAVVLMDINHFKRVNDLWGHDTGDQVLRWFCQKLQTVIRKDDLLVRLGGEEFAIILSNCSVKEAELRAEELCASFATRWTFDCAGTKIRVTASFGVPTFAGNDASVRRDLKRADEALYVANNSGRSRVKVWNPAHVQASDPFGQRGQTTSFVV